MEGEESILPICRDTKSDISKFQIWFGLSPLRVFQRVPLYWSKCTLQSFIFKAINDYSFRTLLITLLFLRFSFVNSNADNSVIPTYSFRLTSRVLPPGTFPDPFLSSFLSLSLPSPCFSLHHTLLGHVWKHPGVPSVSVFSKLCWHFQFPLYYCLPFWPPSFVPVDQVYT